MEITSILFWSDTFSFSFLPFQRPVLISLITLSEFSNCHEFLSAFNCNVWYTAKKFSNAVSETLDELSDEIKS